MSVYFSRGPKQENAGPIIQLHSDDSSFNSPVGAVNYQGKKAHPNNWQDVCQITFNKHSNNSIMHISMRGNCQANTGNSTAPETVQVTVTRDADFNSTASFGGNTYQISTNTGSAVFNHTFNIKTPYEVSFNNNARRLNITNDGKTLAIDDINDPYDDDYDDLTVTVNKGRFYASLGRMTDLPVDSGIYYIIDGNRGAAGIRVARDSGSGNPDDATTVIDLGAAQPSLDPNYDSVSFSHFFMDQGVPAGACRYRLQLQCNRATGNDNNVQINANAQASLEIIEAGDVISSS
tara:strand:- start:1091 stop:1963 length:873 start_codon:yes stop_codon:yes gene_type:complete